MTFRAIALASVAFALAAASIAQEVPPPAPPGGGGGGGENWYGSITDMANFDYRSVVAIAPGLPEGSIFAGFENNESVQLYNGNLIVTHPSSVSYPLNGGGALSLSRVYNSMNVIDRQITLSLISNDKKSIISGKNWVGFGWKLNLGRIFLESIERRGIVGANPGCATGSGADGYDPCYQEYEYFFESPDGTKTRFASTDPAGGQSLSGTNDPFAANEVRRELGTGQDHPILRIRYFKEPGGECKLSSGKPVWCASRGGALPAECTHYGNNCQVSPDGTAHYLVELEDGTQLRLEKVVDTDRNDRKFIRNASQNGWYPTQIRYPGKTVSGDTLINITYHQQECVKANIAGCAQLYPFGEAIKEIISPTHPELHVWTELWSATDPGYVLGAKGMLKAINSIGPGGQTITYRYFYSSMQDDLGDGVTDLVMLTRVEIPSPGLSTPASIQYSYRAGFDEIPFQAPGSGPLLETITYPLGGQSQYVYGGWTCGVKKACGPATCTDLDKWPMNPKTCRGVIRRNMKPEGATGPVATAHWERKWSATQCGDNPTDNLNITKRYATIGADQSHSVSEILLDPCVDAVLPPNLRMAGKFSAERSYSGESEITSALLRTVDHGYSSETGSSAPFASPDVTGSPPVFARDVTTTFNDDTGACFGVGTPSTPRQTETHHRLRDDWNNWRLHWETGSYSRQNTSGTLNRISYVDYFSPLSLPIKLLDRHEVGPYSRAFAEEGSGTATQTGNENGRYEVNYRFEGVDAADAGLGKVKEIIAKDNWQAASTRLYGVDPPQVQPNASTDITDLRSTISFDNNGNVTQAQFDGGNADPVTATRKSYTTQFTWQQGVASSMRIVGQAYVVAHVTPDRGKVVSAEDPNGLISTFSYDTLGRLLAIDPPGSVEQSTRVIYPTLRETRIIQSDGAETDFLNVADNHQLFSSQEYDGIGRTIKRRKAVPGKQDGTGRVAVQIVRYDQVGREVFVSEWLTEEDYASATKIRWDEPAWDRNGDGTVDASQYWVDGIPATNGKPWGTTTFYGVPSTTTADADNPLRVTPDGLGRVRRLMLADGSITDKEYCGPHEQVTVRLVRTRVPGASEGTAQEYTDVTTRFYRDGNNRLVFVDTEPLATGFRADGTTNGQAVVRYSSATNKGADAAYEYDPRGKLTKVTLYPSDLVTSDPFAAWRAGTLPAGGQTRQFIYNAVGRLVDSYQPEKGWEKNRLYDVWGNLLAWQDQLGLDRDYFLRNQYDVAGRLVSSEKRAGQLTGETVTGSVARNQLDENFDATLSAQWEEGWFAAGRFKKFGATPLPDPQDGQWKQVSATGLTCIPAPPGTTSGSMLYFGTGCTYGAALASPEVLRRKVTVKRDDTVSFKLYRSTREVSAGTHDAISVWVLPDSAGDIDADGTPDSIDSDQRRVLYTASEAQAVFPKWFQIPATRPADFFEDWGANEQRDVWLYLVFEKGDTVTTNLGSGVAIDDVYVGRRLSEPLSEQFWDEAICSAGVGGEACTSPTEPSDRGNGKLTTVKSYQDGQLISTKRNVYRGLNGRRSGVREQLDWTGLARPTVSTDWSDFVYRLSYTDRGVPLDLTYPMVSGVTEARTYTQSFIRDQLVGIAHVAGNVRFLKATSLGGIEYDSSGIPTKIYFENDSTQALDRDMMHRLKSITSSWTGSATPLFSTGTYQYDGAGNIAAIGSQKFSYDASGRLMTAWMLPQASDVTAANNNVYQKIGYLYDPFGNILSQDMVQEAVTIPVGFEFSLNYDSTAESTGQNNRNRIISSGFSYDSNGNSQRFKGRLQQPAGATWDPRNRMRTFVLGDPNASGAPLENYMYDASDYRIVDIDKSGWPVVSIRDDAGSTLSEFQIKPINANPTLTKDFLYNGDQLLVERTVAKTAPTMSTHSVLKTGTAYNFKLTSGLGNASYAVDISAGSGWRREVSGIHPDSSGVFAIQESEFAPDETNFIRVRIESTETSGYSAPVSLTYDTTVTSGSANQIRTIAVARNGNDLVVRWVLNQSNGKSTKLYFRRADGAATYVLTPQALPTSVTELTLNGQALASPCGGFYGTQFSVGVETNGSKESALGSDRSEEQGTQDGCGNPPPPSPAPTLHFANAYRHLDHLRSIRVETGSNGSPTARFDYYPFGSEFATSTLSAATGDEFFAGAERDSDAGNDYLLARYVGIGNGRFLSVDPEDGSIANDRPLSWNRYASVSNSPINRIDLDGRIDDSTMRMDRQQGIWKDAKGTPGSPATISLGLGASGVGVVSGGAIGVNLNIDTNGGVNLTLDAAAKFGAGLEVQVGPSLNLQLGTVTDRANGSPETLTVSGTWALGGQVSVSEDGAVVGAGIDFIGGGASATIDLGGSVVLWSNDTAKAQEESGKAEAKSQSGGSSNPCVNPNGSACSPGNTVISGESALPKK